MELGENQRGALSKLLTLAGFGLMITFGVTIIQPIVLESSVHEGVCNITTWIMLKESCLRNSNYYFTYDVFAFEGYFVKLDGRPPVLPGSKFQSSHNLTVEKYEALLINNSYRRSIRRRESVFFDDYSDHPLINCSDSIDTANLKKVLLEYMPFLEEFIDVNYTDIHALFESHPDLYFNCTYMQFTGNTDSLAFLDFQRTSRWLSILMAVAVLMFISGLALTSKYDRDGDPKELATGILGLIYVVLIVLNFPFYFIIRVLICECFLGKPAGDPQDFLNSGSIFIPLVWLCKRCCSKCTFPRPTSPPATPRATPSDPPAGPSAATSRRQSHRTRRSVSPAPSSSSETNLPRSQSMPRINIPATRTPPQAPEPNSRPRVSVSETFPSAPPEPSSRPHAPPISSEAPPSYPAIYTEGTVLPNPVVLQYCPGENVNSETLPPPPSYDEAVEFC